MALNNSNLIQPGKVFKTSTCGECIVTEYLGWNEIKVRFRDGYETWCSSGNLRVGHVNNPYYPKICGVGFIGVGIYSKSSHKRVYEFLHNILSSFNEVLLRIKPYRLSLQSFADIDITKIKNKNVFEIGCNPDLNAYKMSYNRVPRKLYKTSGFRASGGHIHIGGYPDDAINDPFLKPIFVYMLDLFLGVPSVIMDCSVDSYKRRKIYGKAGSYRPNLMELSIWKSRFLSAKILWN